jgi:aminomethyltransferase
MVDLDQEDDFVGRDALKRIKDEGPKRKLVGFKVAGKGIARHGYPVRPPGVEKHVGQVTSGTMSPTLKEPIGLAYVPTEMSREGSPLEIEIRDRPVAAQVVKTPFVSKEAQKKP